ncbi:MAG: lipopolysaccharide biosynthesis protein RfbH [Actinobacteria bacterium]|nr:MAG: lipopolysaccharide biosynthesis protein RfbH [Actinomycetota bacterium]
MQSKDQAEVLKQDILEKVKQYYSLAFTPQEFIPGQSRIPYASRVFDEKELLNLVDSSLEFWLTYGRFSEQFEEKFAQFLGVKHCLLVNSGSSANLLAFMALTSDLLGERKIRPEDEIITVAAGFPTTIAPIIQYGAVPVFVDVTLETANIDVALLGNALSKKTKAVMLAHTLGNPFDVYIVKEFCDKHNLWLIEDNCDALGSKYNNKLTGTFGDIGTSSFYPPHHMTMGEGGAVYTNDNLLNKILLSMRDWGRDCKCPSGVDNLCGRRFDQSFGTLPHGYDHKYIYSHFGYNLKVSDMQAAIGCAQLDKLPGFIEKRRENFDILYQLLEPVSDRFILPQATDNSLPSWFGFLLTIRDDAGFKREEIVKHLESQFIQTRMLFGGNLVRQPCFDSLRDSGSGFRIVGELANTDKIMTSSFWVGVYPGMSKEMLEYIAQKVLQFYHQLSPA